jgi:hypothetical protein
MTNSMALKVCIEELGKSMNLTLNADVEVDTWKGSPATFWEPESYGGWELTKVTVHDGKLQRLRFPKLFAILDEIVWGMIEKDSDLVERQLPKEEEFEDYPDAE